MIKPKEKELIVKYFMENMPLRKISNTTGKSLQTVFNITRGLIRPPKEKKITIKEKKYNIYKDINNKVLNIKDSTLNTSTYINKDINNNIYNNNIYKEEDRLENITDNNKNIDKELNIQDRVITPICNNNVITSQSKHIKTIDKQISRILTQIKNSDISKEKLKDLSASLNSLTKQKQELTGTGNNNQSLLMQIFGSQVNIDSMLNEIRQSKANPKAYIEYKRELPV